MRARGEVEFRRVSFEYSPQQGRVLRDVDVHVPAGTTLAIVGKSGSGKSTLVGLLPRFYDPTRGAVLLDGADVREYALADLRRQVRLVSQDVVLLERMASSSPAAGWTRSSIACSSTSDG